MKIENLESAMAGFVEHCEKCHEQLIIHAFRAKSSAKRKVIYCHCSNPNCGKQNCEVGFYGS